MTLIRPAFLLAALLSAATTGFAHGDVMLDTAAAPQGWQMRAVGAFHFELVVDAKASTGKAAPNMKVIVSITLPGQAAAQARFTPKL